MIIIKKNIKIILIFIFVIIFFGLAAFVLIGKSMRGIKINNISFENLKDGNYEGYCDNNLVKVKVNVTVEDKKVTDIKILEHENGLGAEAESIVFDVLKKQSLEVDTVSGATYSSNTILKAIENAITN